MDMRIEGVMIPVSKQKGCLEAILTLEPGPWGPWDPGECSLEAAFASWGFHTYTVSGCPGVGDLLIDHFMACLVAGEERPLFRAIAPFVMRTDGARVAKTDPVVSVADEEYHWRYTFKSGKLKEQRAVITWEDV